MHWPGYDIGIVVKVNRNIFIVTMHVNYLAYIERTAPKYSFLCPHQANPFCNNTCTNIVKFCGYC
jgi:hypothetical protein